MGYKKLFALIAIGIFLVGCIDDFEEHDDYPKGDVVYNGEGASVYEKLDSGDSFNALKQELSSEGFDVEAASTSGDLVIVKYRESANSEPKEIYANWTYIFGQMVKLAPSTGLERNFIICDFDDGETLMIGATTETIKTILEGKVDAWTFLYYTNFIPITKGPQVSTG